VDEKIVWDAAVKELEELESRVRQLKGDLVEPKG